MSLRRGVSFKFTFKSESSRCRSLFETFDNTHKKVQEIYGRKVKGRVMSAGEVRKSITALQTHTYPLCKNTDMPEEMKIEAMEACITATEKYSENYELAARTIKDNLDRKFGPPFQVVVGEAYASAVTYQEKSLLYMFAGGNIAILAWRTVSGF